MSNKLLKALLVLLPLALGVGCSEEEAKDAEEAVENVAEDPALQGTFMDQCTQSDLLDVSERKRLVFEGNQVEAHTVFYSDDNCQEEGARVVYNGEFQVDADALPEHKAGSLNLTLNKAEIRVSSETLADLMSAANFCGVDSYKVGQTVALKQQTQETLCPIQDIPAEFYGAYTVEEDKLYLSADDLSDLAVQQKDRAVELNRDHPFYEQ